MSQYQTRKSISVSGTLFRRARDFATARGLPLAQLAEQALEAVMAGSLELAPALSKRDKMLATDAETGVVRARPRVLAGGPIDDPVQPVQPVPPPRPVLDLRLKPFCASCTGPTILDPTDPRCATLQPLGSNGALVTVCFECNELPSSDPRYDIGHSASARPGLAEGGRRVGGNGAGR